MRFLSKVPSFRFMRLRMPMAIASGAITLLCLLSIGIRGMPLGIDFTGGTLIEVNYEQPVDPHAVRMALTAQTAQTLLPSPVRAYPWRWADTIVAATLAEARVSPEAGAAEIRRYLEENGGDPDRRRGLGAMNRWLAGDRVAPRVEPQGVAPPDRRYTALRR